MRRYKFEIMRDMLRATRNGAKKTQIMYKANLSFGQMKIYLPLLIERGLIINREENDVDRGDNKRNITYKISTKGTEFLKRYEELCSLINSRE